MVSFGDPAGYPDVDDAIVYCGFGEQLEHELLPFATQKWRLDTYRSQTSLKPIQMLLHAKRLIEHLKGVTGVLAMQ